MEGSNREILTVLSYMYKKEALEVTVRRMISIQTTLVWNVCYGPSVATTPAEKKGAQRNLLDG
jgi:hypothetical protein